jgi:hypothetical protein
VKAFVGWVTKGLASGARLREGVYAAKSVPEVLAVFDEYFRSHQLSVIGHRSAFANEVPIADN